MGFWRIVKMERIEDFQVLNQIGRGGFASVYRAVCRAGGKVGFKRIIATNEKILYNEL